MEFGEKNRLPADPRSLRGECATSVISCQLQCVAFILFCVLLAHVLPAASKVITLLSSVIATYQLWKGSDSKQLA